MKSCAEVPARTLSKVITTAPARPVPAKSLSLLVSVVRRNCGLFGLKKLRGCGSKVTANAGLPCARPICRAAPITARWPRWTPSKLPIATTAPLGMVAAGVVSRITVNLDGISLRFWSIHGGHSAQRETRPDRGLAGRAKSSGRECKAHSDFTGVLGEGLNALFNASVLTVTRIAGSAILKCLLSRKALGEEKMAVDLSMPVLVVDDYSTMIRIIRNLLKQLGFENIDDASDGSAALNKMRGKKYGLVISDWNMEPMTGYDLLKEVRADPNLATTPFIMITAESKTENVIAAKKAGVNNYIVKPFNAATLKTKIEAVFPDMTMA